MIIAIGGVSRSGKSTLAHNLQEILGDGCAIVEQDDFIVSEEALPQIKERIDWESPFSIDWISFENSIRQASLDYKVVIVSGFLVFYQDTINQLYDQSFLIELDYDMFLKRRSQDTRWQYLEPGEEPRWYQEHVWDCYLQFGIPPATHKYYTLSQRSADEMLAEVRSHLNLEMNLL
jgi:uridine kinase